MTEAYVSTTTPEAAGRQLLLEQPAVVLTHAKPDGDAVGAALAITRVRQQRGLSTQVYLAGPVEAGLETLFAEEPVVINEAPKGGRGTHVVVVDTGSRGQLRPYDEFVLEHRATGLTIDHHTRGEDLTDLRIVDPEAPSTTYMLAEIFDAAGIEFGGGRGSVAEALFLGLATDTGWFRHSNADAKAFALASRLLAVGVEKDRLYQTVDQSYPPSRLALEARALASVVHARAGEAAVMSLTVEDFEATGAGIELTTGIVNLPLIVGSIRVTVLLTEVDAGVTKVSFRSKPPAPDDHRGGFVDVNELAGALGGGGHVHAAGARVEAPIEDARRQVLEVLESAPMTHSDGTFA